MAADGGATLVAMIDLHTHLLPELDDGPDTMRDSIQMARAAWDAGTRTMVCTPHMIDHYPTDPARVHEGAARIERELAEAGVPMRVVPGGEIALDYLPRLSDEDLLLASVGGMGRWLLLEMPFRGWPMNLATVMEGLKLRGYGVILAHPERADAVQRHPDRMRDIVGRGALVQVTAGSFLGDHGAAARRTAALLLAGGAAHFIASDAHSAGPWRPPGLAAGVQAAADAIDVNVGELQWMVQDGPAAILEGAAVRPPRVGRARRLTPDPDRPPASNPGGGSRSSRPSGPARRPSGRAARPR